MYARRYQNLYKFNSGFTDGNYVKILFSCRYSIQVLFNSRKAEIGSNSERNFFQTVPGIFVPLRGVDGHFKEKLAR